MVVLRRVGRETVGDQALIDRIDLRFGLLREANVKLIRVRGIALEHRDEHVVFVAHERHAFIVHLGAGQTKIRFKNPNHRLNIRHSQVDVIQFHKRSSRDTPSGWHRREILPYQLNS